MSMLRKTALLVALAVLATVAMPDVAMADSGKSLGDIIYDMRVDLFDIVKKLLIALAFLAGVFLTGNGLMRLANSGEGGSHNGKSVMFDGLMRIVGGSFLISLPTSLDVGAGTIGNSQTLYDQVTGRPGGVTDCLSDSSSPLTCAATNFAENMSQPLVNAMLLAVTLWGMAIVFKALYDMGTAYGAGRWEMPKGWIFKLCVGFLFCNATFIGDAITTTMGVSDGFRGLRFGAGTVSVLSYRGAGAQVAILTQFQELIKQVLIILSVFGVWTMIRGLNLLKAHSEGNHSATMGAGFTYIVGGVALTNGKFTICAVLTTFVGNGLGFCS